MKQNNFINLPISAELLEQVTNAANDDELPRTVWIRRILSAELKRRRKRKG